MEEWIGYFLGAFLGGGVGGLIVRHFFDSELAELNGNLRVRAHERETRFSRWHEEQVRVLTELYRRTARTHAEVNGLFSKGGAGERRREHIQRTWDEAEGLHRYFLENRLFVPVEIDSVLHDLQNDLALLSIEVGAGDLDLEGSRRVREQMKEIPQILGQIRDQLRDLLSGPSGA